MMLRSLGTLLVKHSGEVLDIDWPADPWHPPPSGGGAYPAAVVYPPRPVRALALPDEPGRRSLFHIGRRFLARARGGTGIVTGPVRLLVTALCADKGGDIEFNQRSVLLGLFEPELSVAELAA
jgi:hypothetical protein